MESIRYFILCHAFLQAQNGVLLMLEFEEKNETIWHFARVSVEYYTRNETHLIQAILSTLRYFELCQEFVVIQTA